MTATSEFTLRSAASAPDVPDALRLARDDVPDAGALHEAIADVYRTCALTGVDMRAAAEALERVREARQRNPEPFPTWRELDDQIGLAASDALRDALSALRRGHEARLVDAWTRWAARAAATDWVAALAQALGIWRVTLCERLVEHVPNEAPPADAELIAKLPTLLKRMREDDWELALPVFEWLAEHAAVSAGDRARMLSRAAQVDLYYADDADRARRRVERAESIVGADGAADARARAEVESARAQWLVVQQKGADAAAAYERATATDPRFVESFAYRGDLALDAGDLATAESWYRRAVSAHPGHDMGYMRLVRLVARKEHYAARAAEVAPLVERALAVAPESAGETCSFAADLVREAGDGMEALRYAMRAVELQPKRGRVHYAFGLAVAALGEWPAALDSFRLARELEPTKYERARWSVLGVPDALPSLLAALHDTPNDPVVRDGLLCFVDVSQKDRARRDAALEVIAALEATCPPDDDPQRATLANWRGDIHYFVDEFEEALDAYLDARDLDRTSATFEVNIAAANRKLRRWDETERAVARAFAISGDTAWRDGELATIANLRGNEDYTAQSYFDAAGHYDRALGLVPNEPVYLSNFLGAVDHTVRGADVDEAAAAVLGAAIVRIDDVLARGGVDEARRAAAERDRRALRDLQRGVARYGAGVTRRALSALAIRIVVASDLRPLVSASGAAALEADLSASISGMRQWIAQDYGLELPAIRFVESEDLGSGVYGVQLFGVLARAGTLRLDRRMLAGADAVRAARAAGVDGEAATSPLNGDDALWVMEPDWPRVLALDLPLWSVMEYVLYELAYVVLRRLHEFVGHAEVDALLAEVDAPAAREIRDDPAQLTRLVRVLRGLAAERVPIVALREIATLVHDAPLQSVGALVARARLLPAVVTRLPGRDAVRAPLSAEAEALVAAAVRDEGGEPVLAIDPEDARAVTGEVTALVERTPALSALVVQDAAVRPHLRRVVEFTYPQLWVLSARELEDPPSLGTTGTHRAAAPAAG